jgi:hypothetical protein
MCSLIAHTKGMALGYLLEFSAFLCFFGYFRELGKSVTPVGPWMFEPSSLGVFFP